ncbi:MAG TPA: cyclophilin-like fold protein [Ktedonobacteraceae bacterium]|nr:cyclophilin-like fold protein [Ktedonobacteraceae bacterium]
MFNNPTAHDLMAQLPLTLAFRDYAGQEKSIASTTRVNHARGATGR